MLKVGTYLSCSLSSFEDIFPWKLYIKMLVLHFLNNPEMYSYIVDNRLQSITHLFIFGLLKLVFMQHIYIFGF